MNTSLAPEVVPAAPRRVFLSYSHRQSAIDPERLSSDLVRRGYPVWWDRDVLGDGRVNVVAELRRGVAESHCLLALLDPHALRSLFVRHEWQHALELGRPVVPVLLRGARLPPPLRASTTPLIATESDYARLLASVLRRLDSVDPARNQELHA